MVAVRPDVLMLSAIPDYGTAVRGGAARVEPPRGRTGHRGDRRPRAGGRAGAGRARAAAGELARAWCWASAWCARSAASARCPPRPPAAQTLAAHGIDREEAQALQFFKGKGCPSCNTIGYRGRRAVFEAIPATRRGPRRARARRRRRRRSRRRRSTRGMISIRERALDLVTHRRHHLRRVRAAPALEAMERRPLSLEIVPGTYAVCRLDAAEPRAGLGRRLPFVSVTRTEAELSVVCPEAAVPAGVRSERGWRCLRVVGPLGFGMTGVLASLAVPLASSGVSIFVVSTYDTDYLMVQERDLERGVDALERAGHAVARR